MRSIPDYMISKKFILSIATVLIALLPVTVYVSSSDRRAAVVYSAPTLRKVSNQLSILASEPLDIQVYGSVAAANLIKSGRIPDLFLTVDSELKHGLNYRKEYTLGYFRLVLVCQKGIESLDALRTVKLGLADPNQAPIGYRALAAMYLIAGDRFPELIDELQQSLNIRFQKSGDTLVMVLSEISASGRFYLRPNLDGAGTLLETGGVECIFAHSPFIIVRNYTQTYSIIEMPPSLNFEKDPPIKIVAKLKSGEIAVKRFEATALSFSEKGDKLLELLKQIDLSSAGISAAG
ncbi:MAG: substrate-binding domain-containing protein [Candidatus Caldarchaeum sp.]|jgi:molybdate/tungstate transport system substrate-binding protein